MHPVEIDEARLLADLDEIAMRPPPAPAPPAAASNWRKPCELAVQILMEHGCPEWHVPPDTRAQLVDALIDCAEDVMPGGLVNIEAWGPWGKLAYASAMVLMCGIDGQSMTFKPPRPRPAEPAPGAPGEPAAVDDGFFDGGNDAAAA